MQGDQMAEGGRAVVQQPKCSPRCDFESQTAERKCSARRYMNLYFMVKLEKKVSRSLSRSQRSSHMIAIATVNNKFNCVVSYGLITLECCNSNSNPDS